VIHSVDLAEEEIINVKTKGNVKDTVSQQIHISSLSEVTLGPKQVAIIPMTFIPHFPESSSCSEPVVETSSQERGRRSNLGYCSNSDEFQVNTKMVLDTSRGLLKLPIEASSVRQNGYRLPDVIHFRPQGEASDSPPIGGDHEVRQDCYDVHLSNPLEEKRLQIFEVLVSRPDLLKMYHHDKEISETALTEKFKNWDDGGQRSIAPGVNDDYVATLCRRQAGETVPKVSLKQKGGLSRSNDLNDGLGYLQIRTDASMLVVNLEESEYLGVSEEEKPPPAADVPVMTENVKPAECQSHDALDTLKTTNEVSPPKNLTISVTESPDIDIQLMPYVSPSFVKTIELRNTSPYDIHVMRTSLKMDFLEDSFLVEAAKDVGLAIDAKIGKRNMAIVSTDPYLMDETVILTCVVSSSSSRVESNKPLRFTGSIHVAASADKDTNYNEWSENVKNDPQKDENMSMIFPFVINVMNRQMHIVMDSPSTKVPSTWKHETSLPGGIKSLTGLFYPLSRSAIRLKENSNESTADSIGEEIVYSLGIVSPVGKPISVGKIEVVDSLDGPANQKATKLCRRFIIPTFNTYSSPARIGNSSLFNLGKATLKYNFERFAEPKNKRMRYDGKTEVAVDDGAVLPEICHLQVLTDSADGGKTSIPLILFPGRLHVVASEFDKPMQEKSSGQSAIAPYVVSGFDEILKWLRSCGMGSALKRVLNTLFDNRKNNGPSMLAGYLAGLSSGSFSSSSDSLHPILLNVGSVVHDEIHAFPLYLANHNPVPVEVAIDVGEVEGMSITLAREVSHGKRDGNGLLDRIPKQENAKSEKVSRGRWKGHSRRGLQKFLLSSSEFPQAISSQLQYRNDVSLSPTAAEIQPILRTLYKENDVGYYHSESVPRELQSSEASGCPGLDLHPPGYSEIELSLNDAYPFMVSDSLSTSRRLNVCRDTAMRNATDSQRSPVLIPPGGVARFEVKLRCPSRRVLNSDITNFLATGLVVSTNYGQIMPIFASFEALLGHLQISTLPTLEVNVTPSKDSYAETIIDVPSGLFRTHAETSNVGNETVPPANVSAGEEQGETASVPLFITSTFTRDVALNKVESCNPWFDVRFHDDGLKNGTPTVNSGDKLEIGAVQSTIPCRPFQYNGGSDEFRLDLPGEYPRFPSFYECASEWLQNRMKLQPRGCGLSPSASRRTTASKNTDDEILTLASESLRKVVHYSLIHFNDGVPRRLKRASSGDDTKAGKEQETPGGESGNQTAENAKEKNVVPSLSTKRATSPYVPRTVVDLYAQLNYAWRLITEAGLNILSANLRAQIDYSLVEDDAKVNATSLDRRKTQTLSVAMREVAIRTTLAMPTLVDRCEPDEILTRKIDGAELSVLQFPPTRIADVTSLTVPLRNPTSVPIRVRLAAFSEPQQGGVDDIYQDIDFSFVPSDVHDRYLDRYSSVYVQNGDITDQPSRGDAQHWWEGGGAFILPDDRGDLIQARYNLSITAGPGAHISLVNPSLHTFNGLSMSCGTRCGVREDSQGKNIAEQSNHLAMKHFSPIGASSASGITLMGTPRLEKSMGDRHIAAGGSSPADPAHLAFAVPYSSLDEIVLPPYGTGELGPILFRPPGRHSSLGCGAAVDDGKASRACETKAFESLLFLENSLTGLERIVVRGRGMWESVVLLDPAPSESSPFGDVEYRYGRSTLVFSGSAASEPSTAEIQPVRKEVVVHNNGDVPVEFGRVYFSQAPDLRLNSPVLPRSLELRGQGKLEKLGVDESIASSCQRRGFRLFGCSESSDSEIEVNGERMMNLHHGFALDPGQNLSLFVEHYPDCAFNTEYVALNLEYREEMANRTSWSTSSSHSRHRAVPRRKEQSKARRMELLVGFEMSVKEMPSCVPVTLTAERSTSDKERVLFSASSGTNATETEWRHAQGKQSCFAGLLVVFAVRLALVCSSILAALCVLKHHMVRDTACLFFRSNLRGLNVNGSQSKDAPPSLAESDWSAAFRCLARADPLSSELQAVGREQARQLVLDRYKSIGVMTPQCISSAGVLLRDRSGVVGAGGRGGGVMSGGEKRAMTLSDAMFRGAFTDQGADCEIDKLLPCSLGWRAATAKGLVRKTSRASKSKELLAQREASMSAGNEDVPDKSYRKVEREYERTKAQQIPEEAMQDTDDGDEHKGDVISTSASEGTVGAVREEENPTVEMDLSGFAKVGSQKGKIRKKLSESKTSANVGDRKKAKNVPDTPQVLVYKKEVTTRTKNDATSQDREHTKQVLEGKSVSSNMPLQHNQVPAQKNSAGVMKTVQANDVAKSKAKTSKNKQLAAAANVPPPPIDERTIGIVGSPLGRRTLISTCSSVQSSPSSVGQVSISSRSTTRSDRPEHGMRAGIRPPPGLAPPPGFGGSGDGSESLHQRSGSNDGLPPAVPNLNPPALSLSSGTDFTLAGSGLETTVNLSPSIFAPELPPASSPSLSQLTRTETQESQFDNSGFDVMDFLGNIFGDEERLEKEEEKLGDLLSEKPSDPIGGMPIASDPWATERKSRAAAYGIHVEHGADDTSDDIVYAMLAAPLSTNLTNGDSSSGGLQNSVPLLTPEAMLAANQADLEDGEERSSAPLFTRGSFYSSLIHE